MTLQDLMDELSELLFRSVLNSDQKARFLDTTVKFFLLQLDCKTLEETKAAIRVARWEVLGG